MNMECQDTLEKDKKLGVHIKEKLTPPGGTVIEDKQILVSQLY